MSHETLRRHRPLFWMTAMLTAKACQGDAPYCILIDFDQMPNNSSGTQYMKPILKHIHCYMLCANTAHCTGSYSGQYTSEPLNRNACIGCTIKFKAHRACLFLMKQMGILYCDGRLALIGERPGECTGKFWLCAPY